MTNSFNPDDSIFYEENAKNSNKNIKLYSNPDQEKKERKLICKVQINEPHMDKLTNESNASVVLSKDFQNSQLLMNDDNDFLKDLIPKPAKKERKLNQLKFLKNPLNKRRKKRKFVIEGLDDLGIYDTSSISKRRSRRNNIPIRILSKQKKISVDNSFNEKEIKTLLSSKHNHRNKNRKLAPDIDNFASPLIMFQRMPGVPNRMGHSILMNLNKMFGGKLNIKIPPQPPVIMVNQTPFYSTI